MQRLLSRTAIFSWLVSTPEQKLRFELVDALYSTPKSIFAASVVALLVVAFTYMLSGDPTYAWIFAGFLAVSVGRTLSILLYQAARHDPDDSAATVLWERRALVGAWAFACLVGFTGAYSVAVHPSSDIELLVNCCVMGYIAGISSRNASRPIISIGQVSLTAFPFLIALIARFDVVHAVLAVFIGALLLSIIVICRAVFENIISRHTAFSRIELIARRDALTNLWNRTALIELLEKRLSSVAESGENVALILIDLDRFKDINDTFGHQTGDAVLKEVGDRIKSVTRPGDEVARIGGDEFVVIVVGTDEDRPRVTAEQIFATFSLPFPVGINQHMCGASIGYAIAPRHGSTLEELFRNADLALYEAKQAGRRQIVRHTFAITERYDRRVQLEHDLQFALQNGEMELAYQPIVDPRSGRAICCEALLRWNHPSLGQINPIEFIPLAETTGLIVPGSRDVAGGYRRRGQFIGRAIPPQHGPGRDRHRHACLYGFGRATPRPRNYRIRADRGFSRGSDHSRAIARARYRHFARRLRHRLCVAGLSQRLSVLEDQDRPQIFASHRHVAAHRGHHRRHREDDARFAHRTGGRGRGDGKSAGAHVSLRHQCDAGISILPSNAGERNTQGHR
jgi:diguanylate cyclase (GGDEF)-like protein